MFRPSHRQLEYLLAVCECGHFEMAAKRCSVSQPSLSVQLKLLETQLGTVLVERGRGEAKPTPTGATILPIARSVLASLDAIVAAANTNEKNLGGLINLGVASTFGPYFLPHLLPPLHDRYPQLEIFIQEDRPLHLLTMLKERSVDCIITPMPIPPSGYVHEELCQEEIHLGVPNDHPLAKAKNIAPELLRGETLLTLGQGYRLFNDAEKLANAVGATLREDYAGTSLDAIRQMVSIGMGLSLFPELYVRSEFHKEQHVVLRNIVRWPMSRTICIAWRRDSLRGHHFSEVAAAAKKVAEILGMKVPKDVREDGWNPEDSASV